MRLLKTKNKITEDRSIPGLMKSSVDHVIKESTAFMEYNGPRINEEVWNQILSFFKWTYDTTKSECQVRLYVNLVTKTWQAWAFQKINTGMTAREVCIHKVNGEDVTETPEMAAERLAIWGGEPSDWMYFGTVHHHCSCGAFQSGTDEDNEKSQDGLHITVGKIDSKHHDLHCRFYQGRLCYEPDMQHFWSIGEPWASTSDEFVNKNLIARWQMGKPSAVEFPAQWKAALIDPPVAKITPASHWSSDMGTGYNYTPGQYSAGTSGNGAGTGTYMDRLDRDERLKRAVQSMLGIFEFGKFTWEEAIEAFEMLEEDLVVRLNGCCKRYQIEVEDLRAEFDLLHLEAETEEAQKEAEAEAALDKALELGDGQDDLEMQLEAKAIAELKQAKLDNNHGYTVD